MALTLPRRSSPEDRVSVWQSKDPIGERGGVNLYGLVGNDGVSRSDYLGLILIPPIWDIPVPPGIFEALFEKHINLPGQVLVTFRVWGKCVRPDDSPEGLLPYLFDSLCDCEDRQVTAPGVGFASHLVWLEEFFDPFELKNVRGIMYDYPLELATNSARENALATADLLCYPCDFEFEKEQLHSVRVYVLGILVSKQ
jgi:hypothetical protein